MFCLISYVLQVRAYSVIITNFFFFFNSVFFLRCTCLEFHSFIFFHHLSTSWSICNLHLFSLSPSIVTSFNFSFYLSCSFRSLSSNSLLSLLFNIHSFFADGITVSCILRLNLVLVSYFVSSCRYSPPQKLSHFYHLRYKI